jgi:leucyl-tRNA synthetase
VSKLTSLKLKVESEKLEEIKRYVEAAKRKTELERKEEKVKTGVFTGEYAINPVNGREIPIWISDYVLVGYGTGAIMAVPFADERDREFAEKFDLPIEPTSFKATPTGEKKVNYHLRDWSISRQRYWGTPIPIIHCEKDGMVPVPHDQLPVELPYEVDFTPTGKPPLATAGNWLNVKCPKCGGDAKRDAETLDTFFDSAWYYYRYVSPGYSAKPFDTDLVKKAMPVSVYFGGGEHTLGHTLYARFFTKFFKELGLVDFDEFSLKRIQHGVILGPDGNRMSKSRGNVVNPDDIVKEFGTDTVRTYLCFMMPYIATTAPWSSGAISGIFRFLKRVWELQIKVESEKLKVEMTSDDEYQLNKTIKKVGDDLENIHFNTAVSSLMEWLNYLSAKKEISVVEYETFLKLLAPFAPHITEEIWQTLHSGATSLHKEAWPDFDKTKIISQKINIAVQVNGKLRGTVEIEAKEVANQPQIEEKAKADHNISNYLKDKEIKKIIYVSGKILNFVI